MAWKPHYLVVAVADPIKQHTVPFWLLKRFADSRGKLSVYYTEEKTVRPQSARSLGRIRHQNTLVREGGTKDFSLEIGYGKFEGKAAEVARKYDSGQELQPADLATLCEFASIQLLRTPRTRSQIRGVLKTEVKADRLDPDSYLLSENGYKEAPNYLNAEGFTSMFGAGHVGVHKIHPDVYLPITDNCIIFILESANPKDINFAAMPIGPQQAVFFTPSGNRLAEDAGAMVGEKNSKILRRLLMQNASSWAAESASRAGVLKIDMDAFWVGRGKPEIAPV